MSAEHMSHAQTNTDKDARTKRQFFYFHVSFYRLYLLPSSYNSLSRKKVESLIRFFEPFWISRVFHFSLRTFGKVGEHPDPLEPPDKTYTQSKFDISGSNETMQNALAPLV